ncbi:hypothetical protein BH23VER1_BH23VER1_02360 [soil metagenome]
MKPPVPSLALVAAILLAPLCVAQDAAPRTPGDTPSQQPEQPEQPATPAPPAAPPATPADSGAVRSFGDGTLPDWLRPYDVDDDGVLSPEEQQVARDARREALHLQTNALTELWDTDGDGTLSLEEIAHARQIHRQQIIANRAMRFEEADTDADGFLTGAEFRAIPAIARLEARVPDRYRLIFQRLDRDADGRVSEAEFLAHLMHHPPDLGAAQRNVEREP